MRLTIIIGLMLCSSLFVPGTAAAQNCRCQYCAAKPSLGECVRCNMQMGPWTKKQSEKWCTRCMRECGTTKPRK
jgi:hypothetical protein